MGIYGNTIKELRNDEMFAVTNLFEEFSVLVERMKKLTMSRFA